jgi:hypothetical protein
MLHEWRQCAAKPGDATGDAGKYKYGIDTPMAGIGTCGTGQQPGRNVDAAINPVSAAPNAIALTTAKNRAPPQASEIEH